MRAFLRRRGVFLVSLVALGAAFWFTPSLWIKLDGWVQDQRDRVWERLEEAVGQKVVYDRIAPNVLAALDFQNVRLLADDGTTLFRAASIRLSWDWGLLFQGRFAEALRRVQVINGVLQLDSRRDQAILDRWSGYLKPSGTGGATPFGFIVEGFNLTARWTDGTRTLSLDRGFAVLSPAGHEWGLRFRGALSWDQRGRPDTYARLALRGELRSDAAFENLSFRAEASSVRTSWFDLEPLTVQVTVDPHTVSLAKVSDQTPFDLQVVWDRVSDRWSLKGAADRFRPSRIVHLKALKTWAGLADGTLSGKFSYVLGGDFSFSGAASWPRGALPEPLALQPVSVSGSVSGGAQGFRFSGFHLETPDLVAGFEGTLGADLLPDGTLTLVRWTLPGAGQASGTVHLVRTGPVVSFRGEDWIWNSLGTQVPSGWVERTSDGWSFSAQGPVDGSDNGRFSVDGTYLPAGGRVEAQVSVTALALGALRTEASSLAPGLGLPPEVWALKADARAYVGWDATSGVEVAVPTFSLRDPDREKRQIQGALHWEGRHLDLDLVRSTWDSVRGNLALAVDLGSDGTVDGTASGSLWDQPFDLSGRWVPSDRTLVLSGKPGLSVVVHQNEPGVWTAQATLDPLEVVPGWTLGFSGQGTWDGDRWTLSAQKVTLGSRYPWNNEAFSLKARVQADPSFARMDDLVVNDSHGAWAGSAITSWSADFSEPWAGRLALATPATAKESLTVDWLGTALDQWHVSVRASGLDVTRAGIPSLEGLVGRLALVGSGDWQGSDGTWAAQAALSEARYGDSPLGFRASLSGTSQRFAVRNMAVSVNPIRIVDGAVDLDAASRRWTADLGIGIRLGAGDWESRWKVGGSWSPADQPLKVTGTLAARANTWAQKSFPDWTLSGSWGSGGWDATLGDGGLKAIGSPDGSFSVRAQAPFPVRGEARGLVSSGVFQLGVQGFQADLGLVKDFVNSKLLSVTGGTAEGDFSVGGSPADPEVNGTLVLRGLSATSSFVRQPLGPVDVPVVLEGHRLRVDPVNIGPKGQTWMVSGGARLDHLLPEEYQFSVQTDALSVIPVSYQYTGLSAVGGVNGLLVVKGSPIAVTLGGRLVLQDIVVTLKPTSVETGTGDPLGFNADLTLVTGRKVEFLWPNETLPLLRAVTASGQSLVVKANDVASTWSVNGKVGLKTGEVNYLNRTFVLKEGQLTFQEDQGAFDPRISVRAEWKVRETTGTVTIGLRADGTLSRFSPRFDATPYKSPEELQQLVGTTLGLPTDYTRAANVETALSVASDVGTSFLLTPFEETVKKNFQLDLFTVKTEILKKTVLNRNGPVDASDYLDNTRLFFGKYIGDDLFLQGTLAFRRDGSVATQVSPKMVVEPEFQMEFQTPFFLLNWTLLPQHPETLFVTDNTVTFRWNWSY